MRAQQTTGCTQQPQSPSKRGTGRGGGRPVKGGRTLSGHVPLRVRGTRSSAIGRGVGLAVSGKGAVVFYSVAVAMEFTLPTFPQTVYDI